MEAFLKSSHILHNSKPYFEALWVAVHDDCSYMQETERLDQGQVLIIMISNECHNHDTVDAL